MFSNTKVALFKLFYSGTSSIGTHRSLDEDSLTLSTKRNVLQNHDDSSARAIPSVWKFITDPNNSAFFVMRLAFEVKNIQEIKQTSKLQVIEYVLYMYVFHRISCSFENHSFKNSSESPPPPGGVRGC
jgi:hypothetical protein